MFSSMDKMLERMNSMRKGGRNQAIQVSGEVSNLVGSNDENGETVGKREKRETKPRRGRGRGGATYQSPRNSSKKNGKLPNNDVEMPFNQRQKYKDDVEFSDDLRNFSSFIKPHIGKQPSIRNANGQSNREFEDEIDDLSLSDDDIILGKNEIFKPKGNSNRTKKTTNYMKNDETDSDEFGEDNTIGFIDVHHRSFTYQQKEKNCNGFDDDTGKFYVLDESEKGYFDEKQNYFQFDDSQLSKNTSPEVKMLIKKLFIDEAQKGTNLVNHPIKRMIFVHVADLAMVDDNDDDDNDSLLDEDEFEAEFDDEEMEEEIEKKYKPKITSRSKKVAPNFGAVGENAFLPIGKASKSLISYDRIENVSDSLVSNDKIQPNLSSVAQPRGVEFVSVSASNKILTEINVADAKGKAFQFQSGDKILNISQVVKNEDFNEHRPRNVVVDYATMENPTSLNVHRTLAKSLRKLSEEDMVEVFMYIDECGGRSSLERFVKMLEDRETMMASKPTETKEGVGEFCAFSDSEEEDEHLDIPRFDDGRRAE